MARQSDIDAGDQYHPRAGHRRGRASRMASGRRAIGGSELAVAFATGMCTQPNLGASASAISATPLADFGVVLITSAEPPRRLWLPHSYEFLEHRRCCGRPYCDRQDQAHRWLKGVRNGLVSSAQLCAGRPSDAPLVHEIFRERRARNLPVTNQRIEAREILRRVILIAIRLLLRQLSVTYGNRMSKIDHLFVVGAGFLAVRRIADDQ